MSETLKSQVLAKCGEAKTAKDKWIPVGENASGLALEYFETPISWYFQIGSPNHVVCLKFNDETHSESVVWAAAAQILGIANPETRPFDHEAHASEAMDQLIAEIGSDFDTSVLYTVKKLLKAYRSEPISIGVDYNAYSRASAMMATEPLTRHSDGLLWEAWRTASEFNFKDDFEKTDEEDAFNEWLSTLPPDPLADELRFLQDENATLRGELDFFQSRDTLADDRATLAKYLGGCTVASITPSNEIIMLPSVRIIMFVQSPSASSTALHSSNSTPRNIATASLHSAN